MISQIQYSSKLKNTELHFFKIYKMDFEHYIEHFETKPITSVKKLLAYKTNSFVSKLIYEKNSLYHHRQRKLLVCHDMCGNYKNDRFHNGSNYQYPFQLNDLNIVDIFCYFSHELITVSMY